MVLLSAGGMPLMVKGRAGGAARNKACYLVVGDGVKHALGIWVQQAKGAKFSAGYSPIYANATCATP